MGQHVYTQALPIYKYSIKLGMLKKLKEGKREAFIVDRVLEVFFYICNLRFSKPINIFYQDLFGANVV